MTYDLIIIGGGPAGSAGAVYAARKKLQTLIIAEEFGGQSAVSAEIYNWIGTPTISGSDLAKSFENHIRQYESKGLNIVSGSRVTSLSKDGDSFKITTNKDESFTARSVLITSGSSRRKIDIPGADKFENKGVVYCASCDGPLFSDMDVVVLGGGNAGFESAAQLLAYCKSVTLLHRNDHYKADEITVEKVLANPKMTGILNAQIQEIHGEAFVNGVTYLDTKSGETKKLDVSGVFVEIGQLPNTDFAKDIVKLDNINRIEIDPWHQTTSEPGIWAAGDATTVMYHQNNISAGDAVKAVEDLYLWLQMQ
ncbi:MAG: FAD-dependent oxidoreductase [Candidatus Nomurabacteria bacterium]|nr:FAD-dependent oxidoreductase [Candidatus Nomurabacteria bacterium]